MLDLGHLIQLVPISVPESYWEADTQLCELWSLLPHFLRLMVVVQA